MAEELITLNAGGGVLDDGTCQFKVRKVSNTEEVEKKQDIVEDTGWIAITNINAPFSIRSNFYTPAVRRIGKIVYFKGQFNNVTLEQLGTAQNIILTIPEGFRPSYEVTVDYYQQSWISVDGRLHTGLRKGSNNENQWIQYCVSWLIE